MIANPTWILTQRPEGSVGTSDLRLIDRALPVLADGDLLVRNIYLSLDPTNRIWMSDREQYLPPVEIGQAMRGGTLAVVEESRSPRFQPGDLVVPHDGKWQLYTVDAAERFGRVRPISGVPLTAHMSVLGATGLTAYFGVTEICKPAPGETIVISAAAGAVGSIVGQIAQKEGARVIGIAGGEAKCRWLTAELGFDHAIDYKARDVGEALDQIAPDGVDMNFENVGGDIMDAVFSRLRQGGRMALCGMISGYNDAAPMAGPKDFERVLMKRLTIRGFIVIDYLPRAKEALTRLSEWTAQGQIQWRDHVVQGLENAVDATQLLFEGRNDGKLLIQVSPEPGA